MYRYLSTDARTGVLGAGALALMLGMPLAYAADTDKTPKATVSPPDEEVISGEQPTEIGDPGASSPYTGLERSQIDRIEELLTEQQKDLEALRKSLKAADRGIGDPGSGQVDHSMYREHMDRAQEAVDSMDRDLGEQRRFIDEERKRLDVEG